MFDYIFCDYPLPLPEEAKELKTNFDTENSALLAEGKKIKYKASHQGLFTQALKDSGTGDSTNKERKRKEKLIEKRRISRIKE